jgi:hypothetical protein
VRRDGFARVGRLGDVLGRARRHLEPGAGHDDVRAVRAACDLAAVGAVAESLRSFVSLVCFS